MAPLEHDQLLTKCQILKKETVTRSKETNHRSKVELALHKALSKQKYRMLFSPNRRRKPGPKGPSAELIRAVVEMKQRNPFWGCPRIAQQIALAFHIQIDKDVVRRILGHHYRPGQPSGGPSWLTFLGHMKDSLWSMDLF